MTTAAQTVAERIAAGTYRADPVHSSTTFEVEHGAISSFRGAFANVAATLAAGAGEPALSGLVEVESIDVDHADLRGHLLSPEFFEAERHPEIRFDSTRLELDGDRLSLEGELEIKGRRNPIAASGTLRGPGTGIDGSDRIALELETVVNRHDFGLDWQLELPNGEKALGEDVKLGVVLELVKE